MKNESRMSTWLNKKSFNVKDEYFTPEILVKPIIEYVPDNAAVWCPFDTQNSEFVLCLQEKGIDITYSHISNGLDFFEYEPSFYTHIVSNPPFSRKLDVLKRLYKLNKPFALLLGLPILNYQEIGNFFLDKDLQLLIVDKKVSFDGNTASFNNSYFCNDFLPRDIIFKNLEHNNSNKNYKPSRMWKDFK